MTDDCISPLRDRMMEDMSLRHFGAKTQTDCIRAVKNLATFLGRSPEARVPARFSLAETHNAIAPRYGRGSALPHCTSSTSLGRQALVKNGSSGL
jgi:hypothetical protein